MIRQLGSAARRDVPRRSCRHPHRLLLPSRPVVAPYHPLDFLQRQIAVPQFSIRELTSFKSSGPEFWDEEEYYEDEDEDEDEDWINEQEELKEPEEDTSTQSPKEQLESLQEKLRQELQKPSSASGIPIAMLLRQLMGTGKRGETLSFRDRFGVSATSWLRSVPHVATITGKAKSIQVIAASAVAVEKTAPVNERHQDKEASSSDDDDDEMSNIESLTVVELRSALRARDIPPGRMRKSELVTTLKAAIQLAMETERERRAIEERSKKRRLKAKTSNQHMYIDVLDSNTPIVIVDGPAGTGKTALACQRAAEAFLQGDVRRIIITRPSVSAGEDLGHLPGTLEGKLRPYLLPIYDSLVDAGIDQKDIDKMRNSGTIEVVPLSFMRGRTFRDSFVVADEMQNATADQMKMVLTRLGHSSRMIVTGDLAQSDLPGGHKRSGLADIIRRIGPEDDDGDEGSRSLEKFVRVVRLTMTDVVRHEAVLNVLSLYKDADQIVGQNGTAAAVQGKIETIGSVVNGIVRDPVEVMDASDQGSEGSDTSETGRKDSESEATLVDRVDTGMLSEIDLMADSDVAAEAV